MHTNDEMQALLVDTVRRKVGYPLRNKVTLGILGGVAISLGFLAAIRAMAPLTALQSPVVSLVGASLFPVGLIMIVFTGQELATGNMFVLGYGALNRNLGWLRYFFEVILITLLNGLGAILLAYIFGHYLGLTKVDIYGKQVATMAMSKVTPSMPMIFFSAIGANWLVAMGVYLGMVAKDTIGKIVGMWFPVMIFVLIGFNHVIANFFLLPAAYFNGTITLVQMLHNLVPAFLGNTFGGLLLAASLYFTKDKNNA